MRRYVEGLEARWAEERREWREILRQEEEWEEAMAATFEAIESDEAEDPDLWDPAPMRASPSAAKPR